MNKDQAIQQATRLKMYFPYRLVFIYEKDGVWNTSARTTRHVVNRLLREGCTVFEVKL